MGRAQQSLLIIIGCTVLLIVIIDCVTAEFPLAIMSAQPMIIHNSSNKATCSSHSAAVQKEVVRLVIISDTHGYHERLTPSLPEGDILIHLGDFCNKGSASDALEFANWVTKIAAIPSNQNQSPQHSLYEEIIVLEGNHDRSLCSAQTKGIQQLDLNRLFERVASETDGKVQFLQDQMIQSRRYPRLKLYGASWNSCAGDNFPSQFDLMGQQEPPDIMLAHVNPYISPSITSPQLESERHIHAWEGAERLSKTVLQNKIPLCMSGHVHWGRGMINVPHNNKQNNNKDSSSVFINAATLKSHRDGGILNEAVVVDYDLEERKPIRIRCPVL
ncbi:MAG: hypothetical protein SGBAC_003532 [Bacillariaceae sp.]